jgi:hypothetical protein
MKVKEKLMMDQRQLRENGAITIVAFGDSVTHGAVAEGEINYDTAYWNRLRAKLNAVRDYVPINVINAGIGGDYAKAALLRVDKQVLKHEPDLVIVCFGLNDVTREKEEYLCSLEEIFKKCLSAGIDCIFMTPNMLNTYVADDTPQNHASYAVKTAEMQNGGRMDDYMSGACELARCMGVTVCDCYSRWKELSLTQDTTLLLANRINHPTKEMHELFAQELFDIIMGKDTQEVPESDSTMIKL